ncbi:MAG: Ig-like domain-containing protein [Gammaproteobacteria bacterium]|nr:Ig-like domain-containing protein [Gammaproteobacteria bacterium]
MSVYHGFPQILITKFIRVSLLAAVLTLSACGSGGGGGGDSSSSNGNGNGNGGGGGSTDNTQPSVTGMTPVDDSSGINTNVRVTATFSEAVDPTFMNTGYFRLIDGEDPVTKLAHYVPGTVSFDASNHIVTFTPSAPLASGQRYTATIVTGIKDLAGNQITKDFAWCFVIGSTPDTTPPSVASTVPVNASVPINSKVMASFSEDMNSSTLTTGSFTLTGPGGAVAGRVVYLDKTAVFTPSANLTPNATYTATLTSAATDLTGNALPAKTWSFTTGGTADTAAPAVNSVDPANAATGIAVGSRVNVVFNKAMDPTTITTANLSMTTPGATGPVPVIGTVSYDMNSNTATFTRINHLTTPGQPHFTDVTKLDPNTTYTVTLNSGATDMQGNPVAVKVWSFTTGP